MRRYQGFAVPKYSCTLECLAYEMPPSLPRQATTREIFGLAACALEQKPHGGDSIHETH